VGSPLLDETRAILITWMTLYTARLTDCRRTKTGISELALADQRLLWSVLRTQLGLRAESEKCQ
jgi:hypothetical protein